LGFAEQINGQIDEAAREYKQALVADEFDALAAGDLALIEIERHNPQEAIRLWRSVLDRDPSQSKAGINLALTECSLGKRDDVMAALERILLFSPDNQQARDFVAQLGSGRMKCDAR
jgi:tetratricopeptide (TPR) repeat protein